MHYLLVHNLHVHLKILHLKVCNCTLLYGSSSVDVGRSFSANTNCKGKKSEEKLIQLLYFFDERKLVYQTTSLLQDYW